VDRVRADEGERPGFGALLRQYRIAAGLAQETLAERARISVQAISALERGHRKIPQRHTLTAILAALDLDDGRRRELEASAVRVALPRTRAEDSAPSASPAHGRAAPAIPAPLNAFFGRENELDDAAELLGQTRLLTIAGPGGMGKTRFALALAARVAESFDDGIFFVELEPVVDATLVPSAILDALSLGEEASRSVDRTLVEHLRGRTALLVLDSCERVGEACARIVERLLRACPQLRIVTTTRIVLSIVGETTYRLAPLRESDAVGLFLERALAAVPTYAFAPHERSLVAGIVGKLDCIPLAVELAAARTRVMSLETLDKRLDEVLHEGASSGSRALPTLRAALDWSYASLGPEERMLFERFAVFSGSWTLESGESICSGDGLATDSVLPLVMRLVDNSLLQMERRGSSARFRYLDTVRAYALEKFSEAPARDSIHEAHVRWFVAFVERVEPNLYDSDQLHALETIGSEIDNLRSALDRSCKSDRSPENALRLSAALWRYWLIRNNFAEGRAGLAAVLDRPAAAFPGLRARNLIGLGSMHLASRDFAAAWGCARRAYLLACEAGDERSIVHALSVSTIAAVFYPEALDVERELIELNERAARSSDLWIATLPLFTAALRALRDSNALEASDVLERARTNVLELAAPYDFAAISCQLGYTRLELDDPAGAAKAFFEHVRHCDVLSSRDLIGHCTEGLACVAVEFSRMDDAAELFGAGRAIREQLGGTPWTHWQPLDERCRALAIGALGERGFDERSRVGYDLARRDPFLPIRRFEAAYES
jgi:predicted ATPase/DNA-binding XRE family transcriptional regulator